MSRRLQIIVPDELDRKVRKIAARRGLSVGAWVRGVVERAIDVSSSHDPVAELASIGVPTGDIDQLLREIDRGREIPCPPESPPTE